tara:strand:+ start:134 stop:343 length:210 start_codon:yes stop_codon:yes gene_type:complete
MDRKNILTEGFFDMLKKLVKRKSNLTKKEKRLMKDRQFRKTYSKFLKTYDEFQSALEKAREEDKIRYAK